MGLAKGSTHPTGYYRLRYCALRLCTQTYPSKQKAHDDVAGYFMLLEHGEGG
jgi:hypothetical protein